MTKILQGWRLPPEAALADFSSKALISLFSTGVSKNDLTDFLWDKASETSLILKKVLRQLSVLPTCN